VGLLKQHLTYLLLLLVAEVVALLLLLLLFRFVLFCVSVCFTCALWWLSNWHRSVDPTRP
jgi:cytochrome b subunit of formate dehydrogenase